MLGPHMGPAPSPKRAHAQVIYHLNNKNEDHELDLQEMAEQYEAEIEQILKDTADKVRGEAPRGEGAMGGLWAAVGHHTLPRMLPRMLRHAGGYTP